MAFWSSEKLFKKQEEQGLINPFDYRRIKHGAYELSLGSQAYITSDPSSKKQIFALGEQVIIPPGQIGLLLANEKITIPPDAIGFISIKASIKFKGLINVSGFHVDPGFSGNLKFSVYNAGSQNVVLACGEPVFLIWFSDLDSRTKDEYNGNHAGKGEISSKDVMNLQGEIASPSGLNERLKKVEETIAISKTVIVTIVIALLVAVFGTILGTIGTDLVKEKLFKTPSAKELTKKEVIINPTENQVQKDDKK